MSFAELNSTNAEPVVSLTEIRPGFSFTGTRSLACAIVRTVVNADTPLPSAGTEGDTVRRFAELASQGHHALFIRAPSAHESDRVMEVLKDAHISWGQKYRKLVIEDLVD